MRLSSDYQAPLADSPDNVIERKLNNYLSSRRGATDSSLPGDYIVFIDYRTTPLTQLNITCSKTLFGIKAGEPLNDLFVIGGYTDRHEFIITADKQLITSGIKNISIARYLAYHPMAPVAIFFHFKENLVITEAFTAEFTVTVEAGGKKIVAATKTITLEP